MGRGIVRGLAPTIMDPLANRAGVNQSPGLDLDQVAVMARGWSRGHPETDCGPGSRMERTDNVRRILPVWIERYQIKSLVDAGAGDLNWIKTVPMEGVHYQPFDIVVRNTAVNPIDITVQKLPLCDAILCRHVLNHLVEEQVLAALALMKRVTRYLIATTTPSTVSKPRTAPFGSFYHYDLRVEPFNMGEPVEVVEDCKGTWIGIWERK